MRGEEEHVQVHNIHEVKVEPNAINNKQYGVFKTNLSCLTKHFMCLLIALVETNIPCSIFVHSLISIKLQKTLTIVDFDSRLCNL